MQNIQLIFLLFFLGGCAPEKKQHDRSKAFEKGKRLAELRHKKLNEVSGMVASINNPGLLWVHNDSGNGAEVFLIDREADIRQTFVLEGIKNRDWEDIAIGPGPDDSKHYLYVGDIGDNFSVFEDKMIYRFEEPVVRPGEKKVSITEFDTITFRYSDSKRDAEAFFVDPATKDIFIVSKWKQPVFLYQIKYPYSNREKVVAENIGTLPFSQIVAADITPDGKEILMKNYNHVFYWKSDSTGSVISLLKRTPVEVPYETEPQGESIAFAADNSGFYTLSEINKDRKTFLYFYKRR